ncbi:F-box/kelch-repeat protein At1g15670-like [Musa acuminata AAA Group]|uniref:F-box/kelch-repeat protein At1g15670-like n=1 Tax=Musa acuminata AAA Group TaxID=214697 RepID=UPI0031DC746F
MEAELMPELPEEIARECFIRVPFDAFRTVRAVCKLWKHDLESPSFHRLRKSAGLARPVVALAQCDPTPLPADKAKQQSSHSPLLYRISLFEPSTGAWSSPPPIPGRSHGLPLFCQLAAVGRELVVVGGWDPRTWATSDEVRIYDLVSGAWRRGARMPGPRRSFFACAASEEHRTVFVAGGHDESKNALRSALAYDVAADAWVHLPDMERQRDECRGVFARGAFHVVGGYPTEAQAQFTRSAEAFEVATWRWGAVEEGKLEEAACPRTYVVGSDGRAYMCRQGGQVTVLREEDGGAWRRLPNLPGDLRAALQLVTWEGALMVLGLWAKGGAQVAYVLDLTEEGEGKRLQWRKVETPREFSGHVQSACCLEI